MLMIEQVVKVSILDIIHGLVWIIIHIYIKHYISNTLKRQHLTKLCIDDIPMNSCIFWLSGNTQQLPEVLKC